MVIVAFITFQVLELVCYLVLFHFIMEHDKEMQRNNVISTDIYTNRKRVNIFSLHAQVIGFAIEFGFFGLNLLIKALGRRFFPPNTQEFSNVALMLIFGVNSTVPILASSDLRKKFMAMFTR